MKKHTKIDAKALGPSPAVAFAKISFWKKALYGTANVCVDLSGAFAELIVLLVKSKPYDVTDEDEEENA